MPERKREGNQVKHHHQRVPEEVAVGQVGLRVLTGLVNQQHEQHDLGQDEGRRGFAKEDAEVGPIPGPPGPAQATVQRPVHERLAQGVSNRL